MAKYTVRKGDNPLKLATQWGISPQKLLQSNGIQSLTAGQTIKIPSSLGNASASGGTRSLIPPPLYNASPSYTPNYANPLRHTNGLPSASLPMPNFMTQAMLPPVPLTQQQILQATNGGIVAQGATTQGGARNATQNMIYGNQPNVSTSPDLSNMTYSNGQSLFNPNNPNNSSAVGAAVAGTLNTSVPYGSNPDNDKAWRAAWNIQAGGEGDEQVRVLSRDEVWNRKANQRRRQQADRPQQPRVVRPIVRPTPSGNASNTSLSWRVG